VEQKGIEYSMSFCFVRAVAFYTPLVFPAASWFRGCRVLRIDLNTDIGEGCGFDAAIIGSITSASVAAGLHAGGPTVMRETIRLARTHGVAIGAHPGFADRDGFGRRELSLSVAEVEDLVLYQVAAVAGVAAVEGVRMQHVKPHGALYNMAARERTLADAIGRAVAGFDRSLILFAPHGSALVAAGRAAGLRVVAEGFADRAYQPDGTLAPRSIPGAVIEEVDEVVSRALRMAKDRSVSAIDGSLVPLEVETICVHGDTPGCDHLAAALRAGLEAAGISVKAPTA